MMTRLVASLTLATAVATTAVASADPDPAPDNYMQLGVIGGVTTHAFIGGAAVEGGVRIGSNAWAHGMAVGGGAAGIDEGTMSGSVWQLRGGVELRGCGAAWFCASAGFDVGVAHTQYVADEDSEDARSVVAELRLGLDAGGDHLRFRPMIELGTDFALGAGLAYQW